MYLILQDEDIEIGSFVERKHAEDVMERVLMYFETWI
jgi:hypothetical protein